MKLYFRTEDSERCHPISYFKDDMKDNGIVEMEVYLAVPDKSKEYFWCRAVMDVCAVGEDFIKCGKECPDYEPCNKKSGKCRNKTYCYKHGEKVIINQQIKI